MNDRLRILSVEDSEPDRELIATALRREGLDCDFVHVVTVDEFLGSLEQADFDLIISDFTLPSFGGAEALRLARTLRPEIPFIFVSGTIGEDQAVEALKQGAMDYVLKDRLGRLGSAVRRALREARERAERLRTEQELREAQRQLLALTENLPDVIARFDRQWRYLYVNSAIEKLTGVAPKDLIGKVAGEEFAARLKPNVSRTFLIHRDIITRVFSTGEPQEISVTLPLPTGERIVNVRLVPEHDDGGAVVSVLVIGQDITEHQRALEALRESEHRFREVTENIDGVFWLKDTTSKEVIYVSPAYEKLWGRNRKSLYRSRRSWLNAVHPDDHDRVERAADNQEQVHYDVQYRIVRPDGSIRWIHDRSFLIRNSEGKVYRMAGVADDITKHRELEEQLRQSQKMEAVGQLAGGIAHDFNNMLGVIQMHSSLVVDLPDLSTAVKASLQDIMGAAESAANLTRQLLTFSRREAKQARDLDLGEVIGSVIKLLRRFLGEDISLETRFAPSLPPVHADPGMIEQIIMNLAINARDAMPKGGQLSVLLDTVAIDPTRAAGHPHVSAGPFVCISVRDTGCGISPENISRIFEPFFTTKDIGKGTGLGLATVFGIVEQHHGWIEVESEPDHGATFRVFLPALEKAISSLATVPAKPKPVGGQETILLVEDEAALRTVAAAVLEQHGYKVVATSLPAAALEIWEKKRGTIDLLLIDLIMPGGMSGRELAERLLADEPALKVLYSSGYSEDIVRRQLHLDPGRNFLQKPCSSTGLLDAVRRCLDENRA